MSLILFPKAGEEPRTLSSFDSIPQDRPAGLGRISWQGGGYPGSEEGVGYPPPSIYHIPYRPPCRHINSAEYPTLPLPGYTPDSPLRLMSVPHTRSAVHGRMTRPWALGLKSLWATVTFWQIVDETSLARRSAKIMSISYLKKGVKDWIGPKGISNTAA